MKHVIDYSLPKLCSFTTSMSWRSMLVPAVLITSSESGFIDRDGIRVAAAAPKKADITSV